MTIVGEAFIEITPVDKGFEAKVVTTANTAAKKAASALVIPAKADADQLDASVVAAAKAAAKKAARELQDIPGGVDADTFAAEVQRAAADAATKAAARLANIPAGLDVSSLEAEAANAAAKAATAAGGRLDAIPMGADGSALVRDVDQAMDKAERRVDSGARKMRDDTSSALGGLGGAVAKGFAAVGVGQLVFGGIQEQREAQAAARQTEAAIRSTGGAANVTAPQIANLTAKLQAKLAVEDDSIRSGANMLLTFTNVRNEVGKGNDVFNQATEVLVDMAKALGTDVSSGAIQLGKALNDPIAGVSALAEVGVTFTEQQKAQIAAMVQAGDTAKAQQIILGELRKEFGGSAAAQADDLDRLAIKYDAFSEQVGGAVLRVIGVLSDIPAPVQVAGAGLGALALAAVGVSKVVDAVGNLSTRVSDLAASAPRLANVTGLLGKGLVGAGALGLAAVAVHELDTAIDNMRDTKPPDLSELTNSLVRFQAEGRPSGALAREFGTDLGGLAGKLRDIKSLGGLDSEFLRGFSKGREAAQDIEALDKALAELVTTGQKPIATNLVAQLAADAGVPVAELTQNLVGYRSALAAADTQQRLTAESGEALAGATTDTAGSLDEEAQAADRAARALDAFKSSLDAALGVQIDAERAAISYVDSVQALRDRVTEGTATLDLNTEAGRRNREAILSVVEGAREHIEAMADEGATAGELNRTWQTHRAELAAVLQQLGFTKAEASTYLGLLDKVPTSVFTQLGVRDAEAAAKVRSFAKLMDDQLGTERIITVRLNPVTGRLDTSTGPAFREHGGPVYRGQEYVVGERRPELYVPDGWRPPPAPVRPPPAVVRAAMAALPAHPSAEAVRRVLAVMAPTLPSRPTATPPVTSPTSPQPRVLGLHAPEVFTPPAPGRVLPRLPEWARPAPATATAVHVHPAAIHLHPANAAVHVVPAPLPQWARPAPVPQPQVASPDVVRQVLAVMAPSATAPERLGAHDDDWKRRLTQLLALVGHQSSASIVQAWRPVPRAANGALVQATPGGTLVQVAEAGKAEAIVPLPAGLVQALDRLANGGGGGGGPLLRDLVVQGAGPDSYATGLEVVRQLRAEAERATGRSLFA